ncbi:MAG: ABC transporter substrate-binding protein [Beijerinckiaceae bacterium]
MFASIAARASALAMFLATAGAASAADPSWLDKDLLAKAKANNEKKIVVYASMNEREGHPLFKIFTEATGIEVEYVRASDTQLMARIGVEKRAGKEAWDVMQTTSLKKMPQDWLADISGIPAAKGIPAEARDPKGKWIGVYANYNSPAYNTKLVKKEDLPKSYEDFLKHPEWAGKVAIDFSDEEWLAAMYQHYGKEKGEKLVRDLVKVLKPKLTRGHLAMARALGAGEWAIALNNYTNLTVNVKMRGGNADFWVLNPAAVFYGQVGVNAKAGAPNAARLAANFLASKEGQIAMTKGGRIPVLPGVPSNPPDVLEAFKGKKVIPVLFDPKENQAWTKEFKKVMSSR